MPRARTKVLLLGTGVFTIAVYVTAFALSTTKDRPDEFDSEALERATSSACASLRVDVDALPPLPAGAPEQARLGRLEEQDRLVRRFVAQVEAVGPAALDADVPGREWLGDWDRLADARQAYAAQGATGPFVVPMADGEPITRRMARVGVPACVVPNGLTAGV